MDLHLSFMELFIHGFSYDVFYREYAETDEIQNNFKGLMGFHNGDETQQCDFRFGLRKNGTSLVWSAANHIGELTDIGEVNNQHFYGISNLYDGNAHCIVFTLDTTQIYKVENGYTYCREGIYIDGKLIEERGYNSSRWDDFGKSYLPNLDFIYVGCCSYVGKGYWHFMKMNSYSLRLYGRGLNDDEILKNYKTSVIYHKLLEKLYE